MGVSVNQSLSLDGSQEVSSRRFRAKRTRALQAIIFDGRINAICSTVSPDRVVSGKAGYRDDISADVGSRTLQYSKQRRKTSDAFKRDPLGLPAMGSCGSPFMKQIRIIRFKLT